MHKQQKEKCVGLKLYMGVVMKRPGVAEEVDATLSQIGVGKIFHARQVFDSIIRKRGVQTDSLVLNSIMASLYAKCQNLGAGYFRRGEEDRPARGGASDAFRTRPALYVVKGGR